MNEVSPPIMGDIENNKETNNENQSQGVNQDGNQIENENQEANQGGNQDANQEANQEEGKNQVENQEVNQDENQEGVLEGTLTEKDETTLEGATQALRSEGESIVYETEEKIAYKNDQIIGGNIYFNPKTGEIIGSDWSLIQVTIPEMIDGVIVNKLTSESFDHSGYNYDLERVILPDTIVEIGSGAFINSGLQSIRLSNNITQINNSTFAGCQNLERIIIPDNVLEIGRKAFSSCHSMKTVVLPKNLQEIKDKAFDGCSKVEAYVLPEGLMKIGRFAFRACGAITVITVPDSVTDLGTYAFAYCNNLKRATLSNQLTRINAETFIGCNQLETITFSNSVTEIGKDAFKDTAIKTIYFAGTEEDWDNIYIYSEGNEGLTKDKIIYTDPPEKPEETNKCGDNLTWQVEGDTLTISGTGEMYDYGMKSDKDTPWYDEYASIIKHIVIEDEVISIGKCAFNGLDAVRDIKVGNKVSKVGNKAFNIDRNNLVISFSGDAPNIDTSAFSNVTIDIYYDADKSGWQNAINKVYESQSLAWIYTDANARNKLPVENRWSFKNIDSYFGNTYYISDEDYNKLVAKLNKEDKKAIDKVRKGEFAGSCQGMTSVLALINNGVRSLSYFGLSGNSISEVDRGSQPISEHTRSLLNFYYVQEKLKVNANQKANFMRKPQSEQLQSLERLVREAAINEKAVLITFDFRKDIAQASAHAIIGYAVEEGNFKVTIQNKEYEFSKRILTYDPNDLGNAQDYQRNAIYFNDTVWALPKYNVMSTSNGLNKFWGSDSARFYMVTDDVNYLNTIDYTTGETNFTYVANNDVIYTNKLNFNCVTPNYTDTIKDGFFSNDNLLSDNGSVILTTTASDQSNTIDDYSIVLPETNGQYTITTDSEPIEFDLSYTDYFLEATSNQSGTVNFTPNGKVEITTQESGTSKVGVTSNNSPLPWYTIEVENDGVKELTAEWTDQGVIVSGDELEDVKVTGSNDNEEKDLTFSTNKESILITADEKEDKLIALVDTNQDGTYETPVDKVPVVPDQPSTPDNPDTPDQPSTPDNPDTPDQPSTPDNPDQPSTPDNPDAPDQPSTPDNPDTPDQPSTPDNPDTPDQPSTPDNPDTPDQPSTPDNPDTPDQPSTPDNPDTPDQPTNPSTSTGKGSSSISGNYPRNDIHITEGKGGTVTASTTHTTQGSPVTLTVKPDYGYALDTLTVIDKDGHDINVTTKDTNRYQFTMPDRNVDVTATFKAVSQTTPTQNTPIVAITLPFTDIPNNAWYKDAVAFVYQKGMMQGDGSETIFNPQGNTTGGMIVTILHRLEGTPKVSTEASTGQWFSDAVNWAIENKIVDQSFAPREVITREQLADVFYRYVQYKGESVTQKVDLAHYADSNQLSANAIEAMQWANAIGLLNGITNNTLDPQGYTTRAQLATILTRFCNR